MNSLERMVSFVKVVEANSYVAVATELGVSRAAISKQISTLEEELGVKLIHRTTRRLSLTEAGELYYNQAKQLLGIIDETNQLMSSMRAEPKGRLKIVCGRYFAEQSIMPHLHEFMSQYPKVKLNLELAERIPDLNKEGVDLVIGMSIPGPADAIQRTIAKTRYVISASPTYLAKHGVPQKPTELTQHAYITHTMRKPDHIIGFKDNVQVHVDPILRLNDARAMVECAVQGIGIIRTHDYMVQEMLEKGKLIEILKEYNEQEEDPIYLYYPQSRYLSPKIRHFIDFLLSKLQVL